MSLASASTPPEAVPALSPPSSERAWPEALLTRLAAHAARLSQAGEGAICAWPPGGVGDELMTVSTSRDREWLTLVKEHATVAAEAGPAPFQFRDSGRTVAVVGFGSEPDRSGALIIARLGGEPFVSGDLEVLNDVAGLAGAALDESAWAPVFDPATAAAGSVHSDIAPADFRHRLPRAFASLEGLPALVESRDLLLAVLDGPTPSNAAIIGAIESDVALLIAVLRLANEKEGKNKPTIWSVPAAVEVLTPEGVETMARRVTVFDFFDHIRGWNVPPEHFRLHAMATQRAAERLARLVGHKAPDQLMVAALLHDVGKLVLMEAFPDYPVRVLEAGHGLTEGVRTERRERGVDHQVAGGVLIRRWRLPDELAAIVGSHHEPGTNRDAALVGLADVLAHYMHGDHVASADLTRAARAAGVTGKQLRTVMYDLSQPDAQPQGRHPTPSPLTARETQMLTGLAAGLSNKQMALEAGLSTSTVRSHLHNVYEKLEVSDRAQAVLTATENCWL